MQAPLLRSTQRRSWQRLFFSCSRKYWLHSQRSDLGLVPRKVLGGYKLSRVAATIHCTQNNDLEVSTESSAIAHNILFYLNRGIYIPGVNSSSSRCSNLLIYVSIIRLESMLLAIDTTYYYGSNPPPPPPHPPTCTPPILVQSATHPVP